MFAYKHGFVILVVVIFQDRTLALQFSNFVSESTETSFTLNNLPPPISIEEAILDSATEGVQKFDRAQFADPTSTSSATLTEGESAILSMATLNKTLTARVSDASSVFSSEDIFELAMIGTSKISEYLEERAIALMGVALAEKQHVAGSAKVKLSLVLKRAGQPNQDERTLCNVIFQFDDKFERSHELIRYECIEADALLESIHTSTTVNSGGIMWYQSKPDYDMSAAIFATAELLKQKRSNSSKPAFNPILLGYVAEDLLENFEGNEIKLQLYLGNTFNHDESHIVCNADVHLEQRVLYGADCAPVDKDKTFQTLNVKEAFSYLHVNSSMVKDAAQFAVDVMTKSPKSLPGHWTLIRVTEARILSHHGSVRRLRLSFGKQGFKGKPYVSCTAAVYEDKTSGNYELLYGSNYTKCELFPFND